MVISMHTKHIQSPLDRFQAFHREKVINSKVLGKHLPTCSASVKQSYQSPKVVLLVFGLLSKARRLLNGLVQQKGVFLLRGL